MSSTTSDRPRQRSMKPKHKRLLFVGAALAFLGAATAMVLMALEDNLSFFYAPQTMLAEPPAPNRAVRLGGLVAIDSVDRQGEVVTFAVTDNAADVPVRYVGILPDLFREGQGVVVEGRLGPDGLFQADTVLAKHDENYMPPEVHEALEKGKAAQAGEAQP